MRPVLVLRSALIVLLATLVASSALGFESEEHFWLTESAVCVTQQRLARVPRARPDLAARAALASDALRALEQVQSDSAYCDQAKSINLAQATVYADFADAPRRLLRTDYKHGAERLNTAELCMRVGNHVLGITETIRNPHHFGHNGLLEYYGWHEHALLLATRAGTLFTTRGTAAEQEGKKTAAEDALTDALILEAYAVHFLQDFLAPGHVDVPEPALSMAATLKRHDQVNAVGKPFFLTERWYDKLGWLDSKAEGSSTIASCLKLAPDARRRGIDEFSIAERHRCITLEGDGRLYSRGMGAVYRPDQAMFITEVVSLSLRDVLTVFLEPDVDWETLTLPPHEGSPGDGGFGTVSDTDRLAWLPIGFYLKRDAKCASAAGADPRATAEPELPPDPAHDPLRARASGPSPTLATTAQSSSAPGRRITYRDDKIGSAFLTLLPRIAIDVTVERLNEESRKTIAGEVFLDWLTLSPVEYQTLEWSLGYTYVRGNSYDGQGFDGRAYYRFKNLYLWTSLGAGWRYYYGNGASGSAPYVGGRVGFGPEILSVYTGVAVDASFDRGRVDTDPLSFEFGVQSVLPLQRIGAVVEKLVDDQKDPSAPP